MLIEINNSQSTYINRHAGLDKPAPDPDPGASRNILKPLDSGFRRNDRKWVLTTASAWMIALPMGYKFFYEKAS